MDQSNRSTFDGTITFEVPINLISVNKFVLKINFDGYREGFVLRALDCND